MARKDAKVFEKRITCLLDAKWDQTYSKLVGYVRKRISMSLVRSTTICFRGARIHQRTLLWVTDNADIKVIQEGEGEQRDEYRGATS